MKIPIKTDLAPDAIGCYSQAIRYGDTVYLSGQIPLVPATMKLVSDHIGDQVVQVIDNLEQVCIAAGGTLDDIIKLTIYLVDLSHFGLVNEIMQSRFSDPYPARAVLGVAALPRGAGVEIEGLMACG